MLETASWAALSIALSSSLDALSTQFFSDSATHSVTQAAGNGATSVMMGQEVSNVPAALHEIRLEDIADAATLSRQSVAGATADTWHQVAAHPGSLIAEALYTGGSKALPVAFEELAWLASTNSSRIMATAGAGTALLAASAAIKPHSSWTPVKPAHSHPDVGQASAVSQFSVTAWCTRCRDSFEYTPSMCSDARLVSEGGEVGSADAPFDHSWLGLHSAPRARSQRSERRATEKRWSKRCKRRRKCKRTTFKP